MTTTARALSGACARRVMTSTATPPRQPCPIRARGEDSGFFRAMRMRPSVTFSRSMIRPHHNRCDRSCNGTGEIRLN